MPRRGCFQMPETAAMVGHLLQIIRTRTGSGTRRHNRSVLILSSLVPMPLSCKPKMWPPVENYSRPDKRRASITQKAPLMVRTSAPDKYLFNVHVDMSSLRGDVNTAQPATSPLLNCRRSCSSNIFNISQAYRVWYRQNSQGPVERWRDGEMGGRVRGLGIRNSELGPTE